MSTPTTPGSPKSPLPLLAIGLAILLALSLSLGGLTWWLVTRHGTTTNPPAASGSHPGPVLPPPARASADPTGTTEIFNGRDLEGWDYDPVVWSVRDGVIHGSKTRAGALFWRGAEVEDFELSFRFRLVRGNSGIYYRLAYQDEARPQPYALSRWVMPPAALLGQRLRAAIARASKAAVFTPADAVRLDYTLRLELDEFSQIFDAADRSRAVVRLRASLIRNRSIVAQQSFNIERAAATPNAEGGVRALVAASDAAASNLIDWLAANMKK